jgi:hypothetical protein
LTSCVPPVSCCLQKFRHTQRVGGREGRKRGRQEEVWRRCGGRCLLPSLCEVGGGGFEGEGRGTALIDSKFRRACIDTSSRRSACRCIQLKIGVLILCVLQVVNSPRPVLDPPPQKTQKTLSSLRTGALPCLSLCPRRGGTIHRHSCLPPTQPTPTRPMLWTRAEHQTPPAGEMRASLTDMQSGRFER